MIIDKYEIFKDLANIHLVSPENLKEVLSESRMSKLDKQDVLKYVQLRKDFRSAWIGKYI